MGELGWNRQDFMNKINDNTELMDELLNIFMQSTSEHMTKLHHGLMVRDSEAVVFAAHAIKGSAATLGVEKIRYIAHELELAGRAQDLEKATTIQPRLQNLLKQFKQAEQAEQFKQAG